MPGRSLPITFNESLLVFAPKGDDPLDHTEVSRDPSCVRPISLKNSDNKLIATVANAAISPVISSQANSLQRGFVQGRQLTQNILELDTCSRIHSMSCPPGDI